MQAPTNPSENLRWRAEVYEKASKDPKLAEALKEKCKRDSCFYFDAFLWIYAPKEPMYLDNGKWSKNRPFILYPKQRKLIRTLDELLERSRTEEISLLLDKPRDVGATYTLLGWIHKHWMFESFDARIGSRKMEYVDNRSDPDSLFWKLDYMTQRSPKWLLPKGFNYDKHRRGSMLENPENKSSIVGESANPNFGRGGRKSVILFDELAFWEWARSSWESSGESTNLRICMSTPPETGKDSHFYKLKTGQMGKVHIFNFEWTDVPWRNTEWYNKKKESKSQEEFAREVLKSYDGTTTGKVYAIDARSIRRTECDYDNRYPLFCAWDFGLDAVAIIWIQKTYDGWLKIIDSYTNTGFGIDFYVPFITGEISSGSRIETYTEADLDIIERHKEWTQDITHYGDPSVKQRNVGNSNRDGTGRSTHDELVDKGIYINSKDWAGRRWTHLRDITRPLFRRMEVNEKRCSHFLEAIRGARYPEKREGNQSTSEPLKPIHDWTSHFRSAFEYFADNEPLKLQTNEEIEAIQREQENFDPYSLF